MLEIVSGFMLKFSLKGSFYFDFSALELIEKLTLAKFIFSPVVGESFLLLSLKSLGYWSTFFLKVYTRLSYLDSFRLN